MRLRLTFTALFLIAGAGVVGYHWPQEVRAVIRRVADPFVIRKVESHATDIRFAAEESDLDPYLLAALVYAESSGRVDAISSADALGLTQLRTDAANDAAKRIGVESPSREALLSDARLNLRLGAAHFAWIMEHEDADVLRSLMAYNAGRARLRRWARAEGSYAAWYEKQKRAGDSEVLAYAERVQNYAEIFRERGKIDSAVPQISDANEQLP
ncbi:MAG: soluble lytic murein transglycosylase-like protein [Planctomycetota bacterium]